MAAILLLLLPGVSPLAAQASGDVPQAPEESPRSTNARRGFVIGAVTGGILTGVAGAVLAAGLCEYECNGSGWAGGLLGGAIGAALGGFAGLVIGAAIPAGPEDGAGPVPAGDAQPPGDPEREGRPGDPAPSSPAAQWSVGLTLGPAVGSGNEFGGTRVAATLTVLRPTTSRVRWGVEAGYLGRRDGANTWTSTDGAGQVVTSTTAWQRSIWHVGMVAARTVGADTAPGGYLLAAVGVYPYREAFTSTRTPPPDDLSQLLPMKTREITPFPGVALGGGGRWRLSDRVRAGLEGRLHLVVGMDAPAQPIASIGGSLWMGR